MYFLRGEKKTVKPPPMISYWTWQIGCPVAMDARQSLSSSANQAERRSQHLPFQNNINILTFLLRVFKRLAAPPCFPNTLRLCVKERLFSLYSQVAKQANTLSSVSLQSS